MVEENIYEKEIRERGEALDRAFRDEFRYQFAPRTVAGRKFYPEISVGEGWWPMIRDMCAEIHEKVKDLDNAVWVFQWLQIKEKFGTLRAYHNINSQIDPSTYQEITDIVFKYEQKSEKTCEVCGEPGKLTSSGWLITLCDDHAKRREEENNRKYGLKTDV